MDRYDLVVVGSGPGGLRAALQAAKAGKRAVIIEKYGAVGGASVHFGTLPSKSLRESVYRWSLGSQGTMGQEVEHSVIVSGRSKLPDMGRLMRRKERVVSSESQIIFNQLKRNHVEILHGMGRFVDPHTVEVVRDDQSRKVYGESIVLATGARPADLPGIPFDGKYILHSSSILDLKETPRSITVLGAGVIGCEYASMFLMAGTKVTLVDKRDEILATVDREIVGHLQERFEHYGMELELCADTKRIEVVDHEVDGEIKKRVEVELADGTVLRSEYCLVAMGRQGNVEGLQLENAGLEASKRGIIEVDQQFRTKVPHIFAVGDLVGFPALSSTSLEQGRIAACNALGIQSDDAIMPANYPYGIYTIPEISTVGQTEEELKEAGTAYVCGKAYYKEIARGQIVGDRWGLLKMLFCSETLKLYGVHIVGDNSSELIHIGQAVMNLGGDAHYFIRNVFNYPTFAEAYKTAAFHAVNRLKGVATHD